MSNEKTGLLKFIVVGVSIFIVIAAQLLYVMPLVEEARQINKSNARVQFQRMVTLARAQWIKSKKNIVTIYATRIAEDGHIFQDKTTGTALHVNKQGWPEGHASKRRNNCWYLLSLSAPEAIKDAKLIRVSDKYESGFLQCTFFLDGEVWFQYFAENGVVTA